MSIDATLKLVPSLMRGFIFMESNYYADRCLFSDMTPIFLPRQFPHARWYEITVGVSDRGTNVLRGHVSSLRLVYGPTIVRGVWVDAPAVRTHELGYIPYFPGKIYRVRL